MSQPEHRCAAESSTMKALYGRVMAIQGMGRPIRKNTLMLNNLNESLCFYLTASIIAVVLKLTR
jgi:hypothetical protein